MIAGSGLTSSPHSRPFPVLSFHLSQVFRNCVIPWYRICSARGLVSGQESGVPSARRPMTMVYERRGSADRLM